GVTKTGQDKTICIDYSSPNIAKNFHVGHLRTTVIGNSLYKIYDKLGYKVVRINHLGDWGTQFDKLIVAYKRWSSKEQVEKDGIEELMRIYVKFNDESENDDKLIEEAREWFVKMEHNDAEAIEIWKWFKEISMVEFARVYKMLGISFDSYLGESFYRDLVPELVEELISKNLLTESNGAKVIDLAEYDMPPCLILKSDGGSIYHSRDIAAILYRKKNYNFEKCLYVTGLEQSLHFKQIFKAIEVMGYDWADGLMHIPYGLVSLDGAKLSTRGGNIIYAEDILKEAIERASNAINEKNPDLADKETVAKMVGVGAVIFHDLFNQRIKNVEFSWNEVLSFEGTTGPYAQYTYARAKSILRKAKEDIFKGEINYDALADDVTYALLKCLNGYEDAIVSAAEKNEPSVVARYIISLATAFNKFYHEAPILQADKGTKTARLYVTNLVQTVLKEASGLLGMECPEEM
ncbi:MAG: arginine--tRNA ligase, partial [Lachnospiraceae bacterium]|nr:arginine--tRNA ligase [Lachnospiraceae bacterium]